jgi:hypothetical protein
VWAEIAAEQIALVHDGPQLTAVGMPGKAVRIAQAGGRFALWERGSASAGEA